MFIFCLLLPIVLILIPIFFLHQYIVTCEKDDRNLGIFILSSISGVFLFVYYCLRTYCAWTHETMPDTLLSIIIASPIAWGLWVWRNKDKYISYELEKEKLQHEQHITYSENLYSLFNIIDNKDMSINTRLTAISSIEPYLYGWKGDESQHDAIDFFRNFLMTISLNKQIIGDANVHDFFSTGTDNSRIFKKIIDTFNKGLKNYYFKESFTDFNFSYFIFCEIKFNIKFNNCIFHSATFNKCICDVSDIVTSNKIRSTKQFKKSPNTLNNRYPMTDIFFQNCDFNFAVFNESSFSNIHFVDCSFVKTIFDVMTTIEICQFSKKTDFTGASFCGSRIKNTIFGQESSFCEVNIGMVPVPTDRMKFQRNSQCFFIACIWEQKCRFIGVNIFEGVSFMYSKFFRSCVFHNIKYFLGNGSPAKFNLTGVEFFSPYISEKSFEYHSKHKKQSILKFSSFIDGCAKIFISNLSKNGYSRLIKLFSYIFKAEISVNPNQLQTAQIINNSINYYYRKGLKTEQIHN